MTKHNILFCGDVGDSQSWGISTIGNATGFLRCGQNVSIWAKEAYGGVPREVYECVSNILPFNIAIDQGLPTQSNLLKKVYGDILKVTLNCWDSDLIPKEAADLINDASDVSICLSKFTEKAFRDAGVTNPIHVGGQGVDLDMFYPVHRPHRDKFRFLFIGVAQGRKGTPELINMFQDVFGNRKDIELLVKSNSWGKLPEEKKCDNIKFVHQEYSRPEIAELYREADCFVCPTHGDSFMLPGLEAMASGLPLLVTNYGGPLEYLNDKTGYPIDYKEVDCGYLSGHQAEPDINHMAKLMEHIINNRNEAKEKGSYGAKWAKEYWSWEADARRTVEFFDKTIQR